MTTALVMCALLLPTPARAMAPTVGQRAYDAVDTLVKYLGRHLKKHHQTMGRTAILSVTISEQLDPDLKPYLMKKIESGFSRLPGAEFIQCLQCETIRAFSDGNAVVIEKGVTDNTFMRAVTNDLSLDTALTVNLAYTAKKLELQVKSIDAHTQEIQWEKNFKARMVFLADRGLKFDLDFGPAILFERQAGEERVASRIGIGVAERFHGFGEVGLGFSSLFSVSNGLLNYSSGPLLGLNINELTNWYWSWGELTLFANPGYAISKKASSMLMRGGIRINFGTFAFIVVEYQKGVLYEKESKKYPAAAVASLGLELQ